MGGYNEILICEGKNWRVCCVDRIGDYVGRVRM